jgi:drug/metabolite transporter (DMT)-like permease
VGTYAYVNPVIAVVLGWALLAEPITPRTIVAMALTLGAVMWIQLSHRLAVARSSDRPVPATEQATS